SYDRLLTAPGGNGSSPLGTPVVLDETVDKNPNILSGGGDYGFGSLDTTQLPQDCTSGTCKTVNPWNYNKVNTIFDVAKAAGLYTAFSDKHPGAYTIVAGPNGNAIDDFYAPEINAKVAIQGGQLVDSPTGQKVTTSTTLTEAYDDLKVNAILNQISGKNSLGTTNKPVPNLFAMNFQAVSVAQKAQNGGIDTNGVPSLLLTDALNHTDRSIGLILDALKTHNLFDSTLVVLTAKHGQNPRLGAATLVKDDILTSALSGAGIAVVQATQDDVSLLWLNDSHQTANANAALSALIGLPFCGGTLQTNCNPGIAQILWGSDLINAGFGSLSDRTPDLIIKLQPGFVFVGNPATSTKRAEHGGLVEDDTHVALIVGSQGLQGLAKGTAVGERVSTTQVAVTALNALGLAPKNLQGAKIEGTDALPGLTVPEPTGANGLLSFVGLFGLFSMLRRLKK
ncbi:MAG: alkaline phosphatase family protein, partial [Microcystaceae cyanobacterium]